MEHTALELHVRTQYISAFTKASLILHEHKLDINLYQVHWCVLLSSTEPKSRVLLVGLQWLAWVFSIDLNSLQSSGNQTIDCYLHEFICLRHSQEFLKSFPYNMQHWITRSWDLGDVNERFPWLKMSHFKLHTLYRLLQHVQNHWTLCLQYMVWSWNTLGLAALQPHLINCSKLWWYWYKKECVKEPTLISVVSVHWVTPCHCKCLLAS